VHDEHHDSYGLPGKLADPTVCPSCQALYRDGRWTWIPAPAGSAEVTCPACRRIADGYPAGTLAVHGAFVASHREEIEHLLRNVEDREKREHPLKRIQGITEDDTGLCVATTDAKLARNLGSALHDAYRGTLTLPPQQPGVLARVDWHRD
jgi:NMD protein affecting ribosome stability and mRNA decay